MTFADKLNKIINELGADTKSIASFAGFDRSQLSRLRSGKLISRPQSSTTAKLVNGLYLYADSGNGLDGLCLFLGIPSGRSAEEIQEGILAWLYDGIEEVQALPKPGAKPVGRPRKDRTGLRFFGERLNAAMNLAELSHVCLGRMLHLDQSLISRYRSGVRTPEDNPENADRLCEVLLDRIEHIGHMRRLSELMQQPADEIDMMSFSSWLFHREDSPDQAIRTAESLLADFDAFSGGIGAMLPSVRDAAPEEIRNSDTAVYYGTAGLREAVLRFLGNAAAGNASELLLYSDENQDWLTADPSFLMKWAALMSACVKNGTHIKIIHNIDRDLAEMNQAITSWLPLYISGMVTSFYSRKQRDRRFSHTLFLWPGHACISSFQAMGVKDGIYRYDTGARELELCKAGYSMLMESASPLLSGVTSRCYEWNSDATIIQNTLSIATMPETLVAELGQPQLSAVWEEAHAALLKGLAGHAVNECIPLAADELIFAGQVAVESIPGMKPLYYTPQQYSMHIKNIVKLSADYPSYRFFPLREAPFPNIRLLISETMAQISHAAIPAFSFRLTHPLMCKAFQGYAESLMEQYSVDRNTLRRRLEGKYV